MDMVDLKLTPKEAKAETKDVWEPDMYPTSIFLCTEAIDKMGLQDCEGDTPFIIQLQVRVSSCSSSTRADGTKSASMTLEVQKGAIVSPPKDDKATPDDMYPSMKK